MSLTVAVGFSREYEESIIASLQPLINDAGYRLIQGLDQAESDVRGGMTEFREVGVKLADRTARFDDLVLIQTQDNKSASLAFDIYRDFTRYQNGGPEPKFVDIVRNFSVDLKIGCTDVFFIFCTEWYSGHPALYWGGNMGKFLDFLLAPDAWIQSYWRPETGRVQENDEFAAIFHVFF